MSELLKLAGEAAADATIQFSGDENHLFFQLGERLLISRKLTGNFPDYERVLPKEHPHSVQVKRDELRSAIERVSQFSDERSRAIRFQVMPGEVKVFSSLSETGESEESVPVEYGGAGVEIGFNSQYMLDFLRAVADESVEFGFRDPHTAGELRPGTTEGSKFLYRYVIMPMRI
jgi:DNA polymerase-3 subunit beta